MRAINWCSSCKKKKSINILKSLDCSGIKQKQQLWLQINSLFRMTKTNEPLRPQSNYWQSDYRSHIDQQISSQGKECTFRHGIFVLTQAFLYGHSSHNGWAELKIVMATERTTPPRPNLFNVANTDEVSQSKNLTRFTWTQFFIFFFSLCKQRSFGMFRVCLLVTNIKHWLYILELRETSQSDVEGLV